MDTCTIARLRVQGLPATFTALMTSMAVWFQSEMTSARASVAPKISVRQTIAPLSAFIVASVCVTGCHRALTPLSIAASVVITALGRIRCLGSESTYEGTRAHRYGGAVGHGFWRARLQAVEDEEPQRTMGDRRPQWDPLPLPDFLR